MMTRSRPAWYKPDMGLAARMLLTMFLLGAVYVAFAVVLAKVGVPLAVLIVFAVIIAGVQYFFADKIALASMGARIVDEQQAPELHDIIGRLAAQANLPKPQVAIINSSIPNAFATGRSKNHAVVAVTTQIYNTLNRQELEAVLAHEMTHIINRDMLVMTIATFFSMVASLIVQNFFWFGGGFGGGYGRRDREGEGNLAIVLLASLVTYVLSFVLIRTLSRYRELAADRGSALLTGAPENLATALVHINELIYGPAGARIPQKDFRQAQAVNALFITPAVRGDSLMTIFSTHPSLEQRLDQLQRIQQQMESARHV
ncbi:MAG TPA: zinc metalloprotease HtpX [Ktedonobacterales bacterium]